MTSFMFLYNVFVAFGICSLSKTWITNKKKRVKFLFRLAFYFAKYRFNIFVVFLALELKILQHYFGTNFTEFS